VGSQAYVYSVLQPDKRTIVKPTEVAKRDTGFVQLHASLSQLGVPPQRILIGLEAAFIFGHLQYRSLIRGLAGAQGCLDRLLEGFFPSVQKLRI